MAKLDRHASITQTEVVEIRTSASTWAAILLVIRQANNAKEAFFPQEKLDLLLKMFKKEVQAVVRPRDCTTIQTVLVETLTFTTIMVVL